MKKYIIGIIAAIAIVGVIVFILIYRNNQVDEPLVGIEGVNFTMNSLRDKFLESEFATTNRCSGVVEEDGIIITCNKKDYNFQFNGYELVLTTDDSGLDVYKYMVNAVAELHEYNENEYLETVEKFLAGEAVINGLRYSKNDDSLVLEVNIIDKLDIIEEKEIVNNETVKDINDVNYEFQNLGYKINYMELTKDSYENLIVYYGIVSENDNYDVNFTIKYYDNANNLLASETVNLSEFDTFGNPYLGFSVVSRFDDVDIFSAITKYSISLSE